MGVGGGREKCQWYMGETNFLIFGTIMYVIRFCEINESIFPMEIDNLLKEYYYLCNTCVQMKIRHYEQLFLNTLFLLRNTGHNITQYCVLYRGAIQTQCCNKLEGSGAITRT